MTSEEKEKLSELISGIEKVLDSEIIGVTNKQAFDKINNLVSGASIIISNGHAVSRLNEAAALCQRLFSARRHKRDNGPGVLKAKIELILLDIKIKFIT